MNMINSIKLWWNSLFKYKLSEEERKIYNSILNKDAMGYGEWYDKTHGDDICGHWIKDITIEFYHIAIIYLMIREILVIFNLFQHYLTCSCIFYYYICVYICLLH